MTLSELHFVASKDSKIRKYNENSRGEGFNKVGRIDCEAKIVNLIKWLSLSSIETNTHHDAAEENGIH